MNFKHPDTIFEKCLLAIFEGLLVKNLLAQKPSMLKRSLINILKHLPSSILIRSCSISWSSFNHHPIARGGHSLWNCLHCHSLLRSRFRCSFSSLLFWGSLIYILRAIDFTPSSKLLFRSINLSSTIHFIPLSFSRTNASLLLTTRLLFQKLYPYSFQVFIRK